MIYNLNLLPRNRSQSARLSASLESNGAAILSEEVGNSQYAKVSDFGTLAARIRLIFQVEVVVERKQNGTCSNGSEE